MKKIILLLTILLLTLTTVNANFLEEHARGLYDAVNIPTPNPSVNYKICKENFKECLAGDFGADCAVVYYLTPEGRNKFYRGTHSIASYQNCLNLAGSDIKKRAFCIGWGAHLVQDPGQSHGYQNFNGYTVECIAKYWGTNILLHATCERKFVNDMLKTRKDADKIIKMTANAYDLFETNPEYQDLLNKASGVDLTEACKIVGANVKATCPAGVCTGGEAYSAIYKSQISVPSWWYSLPIILLFLSIILLALTFRYGKTKWKWFLALFLILLLIPSIILSYFIIFNKQGAFNAYIKTVDNLGGIVTIDGVDKWMQRGTDITFKYLQSGEVKLDGKIVRDSTGLTYFDHETGKVVNGPLDQASGSFAILRWIFYLLFFVFVGFMSWKTFIKKK